VDISQRRRDSHARRHRKTQSVCLIRPMVWVLPQNHDSSRFEATMLKRGETVGQGWMDQLAVLLFGNEELLEGMRRVFTQHCPKVRLVIWRLLTQRLMQKSHRQPALANQVRLLSSWTHVGEQDDIPNRRRISKQHHQAIDANPLTRCWWHAVFQRANVFVIV